MEIYRAVELDFQNTRSHPWKEAEHDPACRYHDFRNHPELIEASLEDFSPWSRYPAITTFYEMLREINSPTSRLETNDCAFSGITRNTKNPRFSQTKEAKGRLMVFFRRLALNCYDDSFEWLMGRFCHYLNETEQNLALGVVGISIAPTSFKKIKRNGKSLILHFWAWGDDDDGVMKNLNRVFKAIQEASGSVSQEISDSLASGSL